MRVNAPYLTVNTVARARSGDANAAGSLGLFYMNQPAPIANLAEGERLERIAIAAGSAVAAYNLAIQYDQGRTASGRNDPEALSLYRLAAARGQVAAFYGIGIFHEMARGVSRDYTEAVRNFRLASAAVPNATFRIGFYAEQGWDGGQPSPARALPFYEDAARRGDGMAMAALGRLYEGGRGVSRADSVQAADWYRRAAEAGDAGGMYQWGRVLENGIGVPRDRTAADRWYRAAAALNQRDAVARLARGG